MVSDSVKDRSLDVTLTTEITQVTVYTQEAQVIRSGSLTLTGSERRLTIPGLPSSLNRDSLRVKGSGSVSVKLLGIRAEKVYSSPPIGEALNQLTQELKSLQEQEQILKNQASSASLQQAFTRDLLQKSPDRISRSLANQQMTLGQTEEWLALIGSLHTQYANQYAQEERALQSLAAQIQKVQSQIQDLTPPHPQQRYTLQIDIIPQGSGQWNLEVLYTVQNASWIPLYDLHVDRIQILHLSYLAEIRQSTGENWTEVNLILSTAKPELGSLPPRLDPWYVDIDAATPVETAPLRRRYEGFLEDFLPQAMPSHEAMSEGSVMAEDTVADIATVGGVVTFKLEHPCTVPSDGSPHKVMIFNSDYPCQLNHIAIPKRVPFAYLQATVSNPLGGASLLPGKALVFRDSTFVGSTVLEAIAPGQEFSLDLGIDESIQIDRNLVERKVDKTLIGGLRRTTLAYRVILANLRDQPVTLTVREQIPTSLNEQIKVRLLRADPSITPGALGLLEWSLKLSPKVQQTLYYQFTLEHPPDLTLTGLGI
jgi:uncharacterized protein (TIGR02231 family)